MTFFLLGVLTSLVLCVTSAYLLLRSAKRTAAICRALTALHAPETVVHHANAPEGVVTPAISTSYEEAISAMQALGARKVEAQRMVKMAHDALLLQGVRGTTEALIREAMVQKGRVQ